MQNTKNNHQICYSGLLGNNRKKTRNKLKKILSQTTNSRIREEIFR